MKISVVICAKNEEKYLPRCLSALKKQLLKPEIVVVYCKSTTDNTAKIARKYADIVVRDDGCGIAAARNLGWKTANGDIIAYCDADATPRKNWTLEIAQAFSSDPELLALSGPVILTERRSLKLRAAFRLWAELFPAVIAMCGINYLWGPNMSFRRSILQKYPFKINFLEDYELGKRLRHCGFGRVWFNPRLKMPISSRRYKKSFHGLALKYYVSAWLNVILNKPIKLNYLEQ
jgi:glycosyltransferase involved in cell wall biosynthesis